MSVHLKLLKWFLTYSKISMHVSYCFVVILNLGTCVLMVLCLSKCWSQLIDQGIMVESPKVLFRKSECSVLRGKHHRPMA